MEGPIWAMIYRGDGELSDRSFVRWRRLTNERRLMRVEERALIGALREWTVLDGDMRATVDNTGANIILDVGIALYCWRCGAQDCSHVRAVRAYLKGRGTDGEDPSNDEVGDL